MFCDLVGSTAISAQLDARSGATCRRLSERFRCGCEMGVMSKKLGTG